MDLDSGVEIRSQPNTKPVLLDNVCDIIVSPGIEPGYIVFPSHKNNVYMFSKVYCYLSGKRKFLAVRRVGLMTHREYRVDRPFPVT
jgi:hypothetical protein